MHSSIVIRNADRVREEFANGSPLRGKRIHSVP